MENVFELVAAILVSVSSGGAIVLGLSGWLGKVWADRLIEREKANLAKLVQSEFEQLRGTTERSLFVHRTQFEVEFKAYQELWAEIYEAVVAALSLRPMIDFQAGEKSEAEVKQERLSRYAEHHGAAILSWRRHRPFITKEIDALVDAVMRAARNESNQYRIFDPKRDHDYWERQGESEKAIQAASDALCAAIRERVGLMTPVG